MTDANNQPLDEIQWRDPEAAKFYGGINSDNLHLYFMHSPFCDPQSNNKNTEVQARYNPELNAVLSDRKRFEESLRDTMGMKYLIEDGPAQNSTDMNPVWLIRKRNKVREYGQEVSKIEGSYFAIGENIYQAPSLKDILVCRLLSITENLHNLHATAAEMQYYTPAQGYSYTPPSGPVASKSLDSIRNSRANSPVIEASQSQHVSFQSKQQNQDSKDERALLESLVIGQRYRDEFMDENPLVGEPGNLVFSSTQTHLKAQQAAKVAQSASKSITDMKSTAVSVASSPMPDLKVSTQFRKGSKADKEKTPVSANPGGKPKPSRRRSRHTGSPED